MHISFLDILSYFLALFYTFVALFYAVIINRHQKDAVTTTFIHVGKLGSLHWWNHLTFRVFRVTIWFVCVIRIPFPSVDSLLGSFQWQGVYVYLIGVMLLLAGFSVAIVTNLQMRNAWRSGIDQNNTQDLITSGLFARSRNPAYIGVACAQLGFFFALPSIFSVVCLIVGLSALRIQILLEEKHLTTTFGEHYLVYQQRVPRWL